MFDNLTSTNFSLVSVAQTRRRNATGAHLCVLPCPGKTKLRLNSGRFGVILSLLVSALLEIWLLLQMQAIVHTKALRSNFDPYRHPM